ncbi:PREDICTED: uncharacterized protein At3g60930, chloroplastic-like [Camelina sativa]|uniref:Uncharacterized protein At3g60930, chloroplastic-like n=1 Tax=Camelina sativa TaxID=90675 RepID=A0ABM1RL02_CAMSA|nr:PREDICTED: uncharacterized protein At3g60930, chloroplastic-like [Camelina sativa]
MAGTSDTSFSPESKNGQLIRRTSRRVAQIGESSRSGSEIPSLLTRCSDGASSSQTPLPVRHEDRSDELTRDVLSQEEDRFAPLGISIEDIDPLLDHKGRIGGDKSLSSIKTVNDMLNSCGLFNSNVTILIPRADQRPWNLPEGYICLYEGYFTECRLLFPIPALISLYAQRRRIAICQFVPGAICNFMAALTIAAEVGVNIGVQCFEQLSNFKSSKSLHRWEVNMRPAHNFLAGQRVSKFKKWVNHYFYVRVDQYSLVNPLGFHRRVWNENPDRPFCATRLAPDYHPVRNALLSGNNHRWEFIIRIRVETAMGKPRTTFPSFASSLGRTAEPAGSRVVESDSLQDQSDVDPVQDRTIVDPTQASEEDVDLVDVAKGDTPPLALGNADPPNDEEDVPQLGAGPKRKKRKHKKKASQPAANRKRSAEDAGLEYADRFRLARENDKTDRFAFEYFGDTPLVTSRDASGELFRTLKISSRILPSADELEFQQAFLDVAESHLMTTARMNTLTQLYDRRVKSYKKSGFELEKVKECAEQIRVASKAKDERIKELEAFLAEMDDIIAKSELRIGKLNSRALILEEEKSKLQGACNELKIKLDFEVKRLRRDRLEKVERTAKKAQTRLNKVKAYLVEQEKIRPLEDLLNQATRVQETVQYLIEKGVVIPEERIAEIDKNKAKAEETLQAIDVLELNENDLVMSPDQLGYRLLHPGTMAPDSVYHPYGSNVESFQADLTGALDSDL